MTRASIKKISFKKRSSSRRWKSKKTRSYKKKRKPAGATYRFNSPEAVIGLPKQKKVRLYYRQRVNLPPAVAGALSSKVMRMNSIFDPDYTGVGHQPLGHDQWATYYDKYQVESCLAKCTFYGDGGLNVPVRVGINMDIDATLHSPSDLDTQIEHQKGKYTKVLLTNSRERATITGKYVRSKFFPQLGKKDDTMLAAMNSNPEHVAHLQIWYGDTVGTAVASPGLWVEVEMWYDVVLLKPRGVASS